MTLKKKIEIAAILCSIGICSFGQNVFAGEFLRLPAQTNAKVEQVVQTRLLEEQRAYLMQAQLMTKVNLEQQIKDKPVYIPKTKHVVTQRERYMHSFSLAHLPKAHTGIEVLPLPDNLLHNCQGSVLCQTIPPKAYLRRHQESPPPELHLHAPHTISPAPMISAFCTTASAHEWMSSHSEAYTSSKVLSNPHYSVQQQVSGSVPLIVTHFIHV